MKNMSFNLTTPQMRARSKTVTRRLGWETLQPGDLVQAVVKGMGLKKGEQVEKIGVIRVREVRREPLDALTGGSYTGRMAKRDVIAEGFPEISARQFVEMFCAHHGCAPGTRITRIEFEHV